MGTFTLNYYVTGSERKRLAQTIAEITEYEIKYKGAPTFAYEVDYFTIDKNGTVSFDDRADSEEIENLIERLLEKGFKAAPALESLQMTEEEELGLGRQRHEDPQGENGMESSICLNATLAFISLITSSKMPCCRPATSRLTQMS